MVAGIKQPWNNELWSTMLTSAGNYRQTIADMVETFLIQLWAFGYTIQNWCNNKLNVENSAQTTFRFSPVSLHALLRHS